MANIFILGINHYRIKKMVQRFLQAGHTLKAFLKLVVGDKGPAFFLDSKQAVIKFLLGSFK